MSTNTYIFFYNSYAVANSSTFPLGPPNPISPNTQPNPLFGSQDFSAFNSPAWLTTPGSTSNTTWKVAKKSSSFTYVLDSTIIISGSGAPGESEPINWESGGYLVLYPASDGPPIPCFLKGSTITCLVGGEDKQVPVEKIRKGTLVKTLKDGYKKVELIGSRPVENPADSERTQNRLYRLSKEKYPELEEDLFLTGCHSILVDSITEEEKEETIKQLEVLHITDGKVRLMANVDKRAEPWASEGTYTVWHFALECEDDGLNFGVYANGGLLVETCSIRYLKNKSKMTFH
jgi:hypothetical protein